MISFVYYLQNGQQYSQSKGEDNAQMLLQPYIHPLNHANNRQIHKLMQVNPDLSKSELSVDNYLDPKDVQAKQKRLEYVFKKAVKDRTVNYFQSISFKDAEYFKEDYIEIFDITAKKPYICKLKQIIKVPNSLEEVPFIQVQWCLKKFDLPFSFGDIYNDLSQAEIFPSTIKSYLYIQSIKTKCTILSLEDYSERAMIPDSFYFTRANYITEQQIFKPDPSTWKTQCFCKRPLNPDRSYVQCQNCQKWFHCQCAQIADYSGVYTCQPCKAPRRNIRLRW